MSLFFFIICAKQGMPPGGPEDRTPPMIIRTLPLSNETRVDLKSDVHVWFNEAVRIASASEAVFISPYPGEKINFRWRGRRLRIAFNDSLKRNCTYVITFGTGIRDYRNNHLENSYSLAFSTGDSLDRGEIFGTVYTRGDAHGIDVWAYRMTAIEEPDPAKLEPDYIVQCSRDGHFQFSYLSQGQYRVFAVRDRISDRFYQPVEDEIGIPFRDIHVFGDSVRHQSPLSFKIMREDTLPPSLVRQIPLDQNKIILQFNEPVFLTDDFSVSIQSYLKKERMEPLEIQETFLNPTNQSQIQVITETQNQDTLYQLSLEGIRDQARNDLEPTAAKGQFLGVGIPDTTPPVLMQTMPHPREDFVQINTKLNLQFNEPIDRLSFPQGLILADTSGHDVKGSIEWISPVEVVFQPDGFLDSETLYRIGISGEGVRDLAGNALADTVIHFKTVNIDTLSEIAGTILDPDSTNPTPCIIIARQLEDRNIVYQADLAQAGPYRIQNVLPGRYLLEGYCDADQNGEYSYGSVYPFKPSERFTVYQDTVKVRSRWPNEGNNLRLP